MVFFICSGCQDTLKIKVLLEHPCCFHGAYLSCVDCGSDFASAKDATQHKTCISEEQKYQGGLYRPKSAKLDPQVLWLDQIRRAEDRCKDSTERAILEKLIDFPNCPRKLKPFINFSKNSLKFHNEALLERVYNTIMKEKIDLTSNSVTSVSEDKKRKREEEEEQTIAESTTEMSTTIEDNQKQSRKAIRKYLKKTLEGEPISIKKLRKKLEDDVSSKEFEEALDSLIADGKVDSSDGSVRWK
jgi:cell growth-regulating nucleolar protein